MKNLFNILRLLFGFLLLEGNFVFGQTADGCWDDLDMVFESETMVNDSSIPRTYVLCPDTLYTMGRQSDTGQFIGGFGPIAPRNNVHYKCGESGEATNNCIVDGGDFHVVSFGILFDEDHSNVLIEGITFRRASAINILLANQGDITFRDCAVTDSTNESPVAIFYTDFFRRHLREMEYGDAFEALKQFTDEMRSGSIYERIEIDRERGLQIENPDVLTTLVATFDSCTFERNNGITPDGQLVRPGVITADYSNDILVVENCIFKDNNFGDIKVQNFGWGINTIGPLTIRNTCFIDNNFRRQATVVLIGEPDLEYENVYGTEDDDLACQFIAQFPSLEDTNDVTNFVCIEYDASSCSVPTRPPSAAFTLPPTPAPARPTRPSGPTRWESPEPSAMPTMTAPEPALATSSAAGTSLIAKIVTSVMMFLAL